MIYKKNYSTNKGIDCLNGCIVSYLRFEDIEIEEYDLFFMGKGYSFNYYGIDNEKNFHFNPGNYEKNFLEKCFRSYRYYEKPSYKSAKSILLKHIEEESKITLNVKAKYLTYSPIFKNAGEGHHFINVIGYNKTEFFVSDTYVPVNKPGTIYHGWVKQDEILRAWSGSDFGYYIFYSPSELVIKNYFNTDIYRQFLRDYYCNRSQSLQIENSWNEIFADLDSFFEKDTLSCTDLQKVLYNINFELRVSGYMSLKYYIQKMLIDRCPNTNISEEYNKIVYQWNLICFRFVKLSFAMSHENYNRLKQDIYKLLKKEGVVIERLIKFSEIV